MLKQNKMLQSIYNDMLDFIEGLDLASKEELQKLLNGSVNDRVEVLHQLDKTIVKQLDYEEQNY